MAYDALWSLAALKLAVLEHIREGVAADSLTFPGCHVQLHLRLPGDDNKNGTSRAFLSNCPSEGRNTKCYTVKELLGYS